MIEEIFVIPFVVLFDVDALFWYAPFTNVLVEVPAVPGITTLLPEFQAFIKSTLMIPLANLKLSEKNLFPLIAPAPLDPPPRPQEPYTTVDNLVLSLIL